MKDLDFDEIDRAVNSLTTKSTPADETVAPPPATQPLATRRSSGRFMDVVHPSSDMRTKPVLTRSVSREGSSVATTTNNIALDSDNVVSQNPAWSPPSAPVVVKDTTQPVTSDWPDPIDFHSSVPDETLNTSTEPTPTSQPPIVADDDTDIDRIADSINQTISQEQESQAPLETPFLADVKVSKRPLGALSNEEITTPVIKPIINDTSSSIAAEPEVQPPIVQDDLTPTGSLIEADVPLPAELQDDLLLIEAGVDSGGHAAADDSTAPLVSQATVVTGPTSITQQYTEQPSTGNQPTVAIFDTEAYHKPLTHPAKKKSGWLMVLWIIALLVVGAGAGAAVYFFVLPKL